MIAVKNKCCLMPDFTCLKHCFSCLWLLAFCHKTATVNHGDLSQQFLCIVNRLFFLSLLLRHADPPNQAQQSKLRQCKNTHWHCNSHKCNMCRKIGRSSHFNNFATEENPLIQLPTHTGLLTHSLSKNLTSCWSKSSLQSQNDCSVNSERFQRFETILFKALLRHLTSCLLLRRCCKNGVGHASKNHHVSQANCLQMATQVGRVPLSQNQFFACQKLNFFLPQNRFFHCHKIEGLVVANR